MLYRIIQLVTAGAVGGTVVAAATHHDSVPVLTATDIGFAQDMSVHHQQAVTLADMVSADAAPEIRALADEIRLAQVSEIGRMTGWLQVADAPPASAHPMMWMHSPGVAGSMAMPGMAGRDDLSRLQRSTGRQNEILFLQLMTRHHQGGIDMAAYAAQHTTTDSVRHVAALMVDEQTQEVQLMAILLAQRDAGPLTYP
jgi:uncharacterized protein (DUF305 family)